MKKIESLIKKAKNINVSGVLEGRRNKKSGAMEDIARQRAEICAVCPSNVQEPIEELQIKDDEISEISCRCCNECGCALPYLTRQKNETCKLKKWPV